MTTLHCRVVIVLKMFFFCLVRVNSQGVWAQEATLVRVRACFTALQGDIKGTDEVLEVFSGAVAETVICSSSSNSSLWLLLLGIFPPAIFEIDPLIKYSY